MNRALQCHGAVSRCRAGQLRDLPLPVLAKSIIVAAGFWFAVSAAATVVTVWNQAALTEVTPVSKLGPPAIARALAIAHTCMYDAWSVYDVSAAATLGDTPRRPASERTDANKAKAISYAAYNCQLNLFPGGASRLAAVMTGLGYDPNDKSTDLTTPQGIGNVAAARVIHFRRDDGSNQYGNLSASRIRTTQSAVAVLRAANRWILPAEYRRSLALAALDLQYRRHPGLHCAALGARHAVRIDSCD